MNNDICDKYKKILIMLYDKNNNKPNNNNNDYLNLHLNCNDDLRLLAPSLYGDNKIIEILSQMFFK